MRSFVPAFAAFDVTQGNDPLSKGSGRLVAARARKKSLSKRNYPDRSIETYLRQPIKDRGERKMPGRDDLVMRRDFLLISIRTSFAGDVAPGSLKGRTGQIGSMMTRFNTNPNLEETS